jgi:dsRNA-specific ribonuclease
MINGVPLTAEQKERYKKGKEVATEDGTTIQYSGTDKQGVRSDKLALIASLIVDGGMSYIVFKGLNALFNRKEEENTKRGVGKNYHSTLQDMQKQEVRNFVKPVVNDLEEEQSETISR